jgi:hypothetical protein
VRLTFSWLKGERQALAFVNVRHVALCAMPRHGATACSLNQILSRCRGLSGRAALCRGVRRHVAADLKSRSLATLLEVAEQGGACLRHAVIDRFASRHHRPTPFFNVRCLLPCTGLFQRRQVTGGVRAALKLVDTDRCNCGDHGTALLAALSANVLAVRPSQIQWQPSRRRRRPLLVEVASAILLGAK